MKSMCCFLLLILCLGLFVGCGSQDDNGSKVFEVRLEGNPTTGYEWTYIMDKDGIVKEDSFEYVQNQADENGVGTGGIYIFQFSGVAEGDVALTFEYARQWEDEPQQTVVYELHVDASGYISQK